MEYTTEIEVSGATVPASLQGIVLEIYIAGQKLKYKYPPQPNIAHTFTWDGKDAYGRPVNGKVDGLVRVGYRYNVIYFGDPAPYGRKNFGGFPSAISSITGGVGRQSSTLWSSWNVKLGAIDARGQGLGGWSLDAHHVYDPVAKTVYKGDGSRIGGTNTNTVIKILAGSATANAVFPGDGLSATSVGFHYTGGIAIGADNALYFPQYGGKGRTNAIRKIDANGIITTIAGEYTLGCGFSGDGGPAAQARLYSPMDVAFAPDGSLYIADTLNNRIRKIDANGIITTVAGNGLMNCSTACGDNGPAINAVIWHPTGIAVAPDGVLYIAEENYHLVRKVDKNGIITTVAGKRGTGGFLGDGGLAKDSRLNYPRDVALDKLGNLYIADAYNHRIRKVAPDGVITTVAGFGGTGFAATGYSGDGGPATGAKMFNVASVSVAPDGSLVIGDFGNQKIRIVNQQGIINTIAGAGATNADGSPAYTTGLAITNNAPTLGLPNGDILIVLSTSQIARITNANPGFNALDYAIASEDGSTLWMFDRNGKHLQTRNALTGAVIHTFGYDAVGKLITVTDGDGNVTTIQRDGAGNATGILSPYGVRTALTLNANGYLASVTDPGGNSTRFTYAPDGLMSSMTDPNGGVYTFTHDAMGKLTADHNPVGGGWTLTSSKTRTIETSSITSAEGRTDTTLRELLPTGGERMTLTSPSGAVSITDTLPNASTVTTAADGTVTTTTKSPDSRYGMNSPVTSPTVKLPSGLTMTSNSTRAVTLSNPSDPLTVTSITDKQIVNGKTYASVFNAVARTNTKTSPAGRTKVLSYEASGRISQLAIGSLTPISYGYDSRGRLVSQSQGTRTLAYSYDAIGNMSNITDSAGKVTSYGYDTAGRKISVTLPDGRIISYTYDANGNNTSITPPSRQAHGFAYTPANIESSYNPPPVAGSGSTSTTYAYNLDKQLTTITRPDGQIVNYTYNTGRKISSVNLNGASLSFTYNSSGQCCGGGDNPSTIVRTEASGLSESLAYVYDGKLQTSATWSGEFNASLAWTYNNDFRPASQSVNGANTVSFGYDADGMLTSAGALAITRNAQNGYATGTSLGSMTTTAGYNTFGELTAITAKYTASTMYDVQHTRDVSGRITRKVETVSGVSTTYDYSYDTAGRLVGVSKNGVPSSSYTYDFNGNRIAATMQGATVSGGYDSQDRLLTYGAASYVYTANGEISGKTVNGMATSYSYDALGNLVSATLPDGTLIEYVIDGENRRVGKKVNGLLSQGLVYENALEPVAELDGIGSVIARYVYATRENTPDYMIKGGVTYRIISDYLGSPRLVVNIADGSIAQRMDYDEFGNITNDTNPGFQPFGFAGGIYDQHTKLTRHGARDYDAETGRWTAKDPIKFKGGDTNLFGYVNNNPVDFYDLKGLKGCGPGGMHVDPSGMVGECCDKHDNCYEKQCNVSQQVDCTP